MADQTDPPAQTPKHSFAPWRTLLIWLIPPILALVVYLDRVGGVDTLGPWLSELVMPLGSWLTDFAERLPQNGLKIALVLAIFTALFYAVFQLLGLWSDGGDDARANAPLKRVWRILSGRPATVAAGRYRSDLCMFGGDALLAPLRLGMAAFPLFGFLGTVIGLSGAIRDLPEAVSDKAKLDPVLQELYVAFDTTFLGLVGAVICLFAVSFAESRLDALAHADQSR